MLLRKKILSYPFALAVMMISSTAMAKIPPTAFKHITRHFKSGKEAYSPVLGETALETGLIENLRFFGPFTPAYKTDGTRDYTRDSSSDPLWNVVKVLFPSFSGTLGVDSQGITNFGRYVHSPKTVALLLKYANQIRGNVSVQGETLMTEILTSLNIEQKQIRNLKRTTLTPLLKYIKESVEQEQTQGTLYPQYTIEQIIEAFFCYKFNTQKDIQQLIKELPEDIVEKSVPFTEQEDLLTESDIKIISTQEGKLDLDDVFALGNASIFTSILPYREGISPLSNGNCQFYDRKDDKFINPGKTFADCAEISARHILNMILYNPTTKAFDLSSILELKKNLSPGSPAEQRIDHIIDFYKTQSIYLANSGDIAIRSAWNRGVGDLNAIQDELPPIRYVQDNNELSSGIINFIYAFQKIFSLSLPTQPNETDTQKSKEKWVETSFETLFQALNPTRSYKIDASALKWEKNKQDFSGSMKVSVSENLSKEGLFEFSLFIGENHSEIRNLNFLKTPSIINVDKVFKTQPTTIHQGTAEDSLWLLAPFLTEKIDKDPLYKLYQYALADNNSKIEFIETLSTIPIESLSEKTIGSLNLMLSNVLKALSWEDEHVLTTFTNLMKTILSQNNVASFKETFLKDIPGLSLSKNKEDQKLVDGYFSQFQNLKSFKFNGILPELNSAHATLEKLDLSKSNLKKLAGLNHLKKVNELYLNSTESLLSLAFSPENSALKELYLYNSGIKEIKGLDHLKSLKKLELSSTSELKSLEFSEDNYSLKNINLKNSGIKNLVGISHMKAITDLLLSETPNLKTLSFSEENSSLAKLDLSNSNIEEVLGLGNLKNLILLNLSSAKKLNSIAFSQNNSFLRSLNLNETGIKSLEGLGNLKALQTLLLKSTPNLKTLSFSERNSNLKELDVTNSKINEITGVNFLRRLTKLTLDSTPNLKSLSFSAHNSFLKELSLMRSGIEELSGIHYLRNLKILTLSSTKNFKTALEFSENNSHLEELKLSGSKIIDLKGLDHLKGLKKLLVNSTNLNMLTFSADNYALEELNLSDSEVAELAGMQHLKGLKKLKIEETRNLTSLTFSVENKNLEELSLQNSNIEELKGLDHLPKLKKLIAYGTSNLTSLSFSKENTSLQVLDLKNSDIEELTGLANLKNLKSLDLTYSDKIQEIKVSRKVNVTGLSSDKIKWIEDEVDG